MVVGGKLLALLLPFSLLLSLAYSATYTVTSTAATCFATLGSAAVGSTTFAARGFSLCPSFMGTQNSSDLSSVGSQT